MSQRPPEDVPSYTPWARVSSLLSYALESLSLPSHAQHEQDADAKRSEEEGLSKATEAVRRARAVAADTEDYAQRMSEPAPPMVQTRCKETAEYDWNGAFAQGLLSRRLHAGMCAGEYEAVVIAKLAELCRAKTVLEIGMFTGTTAMAMAAAPGVERVTCLDVEPYLFDLNRPSQDKAGLSSKIRTMIKPALEALEELASKGETFDFVFIDADKENYWSYYDFIISRNLLSYPHGVIAVDNVLFKAYVTAAGGSDGEMAPGMPNMHDWETSTRQIDDFNRRLRHDHRTEVVMLAVRDGVSLVTWKRT